MTKLNRVLLSVVVLLVIFLGAASLWMPGLLGSSYYAVYLTSGDLYFGKMAWYNPYTLTDVRAIQQQKDEKEQPTLNLVDFSKSVVWGPAEDLRLNKKNILWTSKLTDESQVVKLIKGREQ